MSSYSDYANAASDILLKKGEAAARAKEQTGQIWGSTIANLGQTIPKQVQDAMALGAQKRKTAQIQSIIQQNGGDLEKSLPAIYGIDATLGGQVAEHVAKVNKDLAEYQDLQDKHQSAQLDLANKYLDGVHDETSYAQWAVLQNKLGRKVPPQYDPEFIKQERDSLTERQRALAESKLGFGSSPEGIYSKGTGAIAHPATPKRTFERVGPNQTLIETTPGLQTPYGGTQQIGTVEPPPTAPGETPTPTVAPTAISNTGTRVIATGPPAAMTPAQQAAQAETARHNKVSEATADYRAHHPASGATVNVQSGLSDEALNQAADKFYETGILPSSGMGAQAAADKRAIMNRSAERHAGATLAANSAEYKANSASLSKIQVQRDAVVSFEKTANQNLDRFLETAKGVVDSGSPLINAPLRAVANSAFGSQNQAAFNAARLVAQNEIAKVTSNPNLTGQLSDSARKEMEQAISPSATLGQIYAAAKVLRADMGSRRTSLDDQIQEIKTRLGGNPAAKKTPAVGDPVMWQGKRYRIKAITNGQAELEPLP